MTVRKTRRADLKARRVGGGSLRASAGGPLRANLGWAILGLLLFSSCSVRRTLSITSEPPNAEVRLDGILIGNTPLKHRFDHYGVRKLTLHHGNCCAWTEVIRLDPPWWNRFPLDYVSEIALPFGWRDRRNVHAKLVPGTDVLTRPDLTSVFERKRLLSNADGDRPTDFPDANVLPIPTAENP